MTDDFVLIASSSDVTEEVMDAVRSIESGWYKDQPIDWEDVWDRLDGTMLEDGRRVDLGPELGSAAMRRIQRVIRAERKAG